MASARLNFLRPDSPFQPAAATANVQDAASGMVIGSGSRSAPVRTEAGRGGGEAATLNYTLTAASERGDGSKMRLFKSESGQ